MEANYTNYVELLASVSHDCPAAHLFISSVLPRVGKGQTQINEQITEFNKRLATLATMEENVTFIDNDIHLKDSNGAIESLYKKRDITGVHINEDGKGRLSASMQDAVKEVVFKHKLEVEWVKV